MIKPLGTTVVQLIGEAFSRYQEGLNREGFVYSVEYEYAHFQETIAGYREALERYEEIHDPDLVQDVKTVISILEGHLLFLAARYHYIRRE